MKNKIIYGIICGALSLTAMTGCSSDDEALENSVNTTPNVAPLTITVGNNAKSSRVIIQDNDGKNTDTSGRITIGDMVWESGDVIWAYSPDYVDGSTKGGYTRLVCETNGTNSAVFKPADGVSKYVPGKPLYVYYHGGSRTSSNGEVSGSSVGTGTADSTIAYFTRPYDSDNTNSSQLFIYGTDTQKSVKNDPFFVRSAYIAKADSTGNIKCNLEGRMPMLSLRIPLFQGVTTGLTTLLGAVSYEITVACQDESGNWGFPGKIALKYNADGTLSQSVVGSYGSALKYTIAPTGILNANITHPTALIKGNGMVYISIPAIKYNNLRIGVKLNHVGTGTNILKFVLANTDLLTQTFTYPKKDQNVSFTVDVNNSGDTEDDANNVFATGDVMSLDGDASGLPGLGFVIGGTLGIIQGPGAGWGLTDGSIIELPH